MSTPKAPNVNFWKISVRKTIWDLQLATKWVETLRPKRTFWRFPDFKRGKDSVSSPIPSMQCCATVRATFRKQETSQLWMEGTGEGCGFLCFRSYPIWVKCLNNFVADRRQNELRHFALNGLFDVFLTSKGGKIAFPPPSLQAMLCHCSSYL